MWIAIIIAWALAALMVIWVNIDEMREVDNCAQWLAVVILLVVGAPFILGATGI